jgi:hypothetical protein
MLNIDLAAYEFINIDNLTDPIFIFRVLALWRLKYFSVGKIAKKHLTFEPGGK